MGIWHCCNDRKYCRKLLVNETVEIPVTPTCLPVDCLEQKTDRMSNKLLHTESAAKYIHTLHMQMKLNIAIFVREVGERKIQIIPFVIMLSLYFAISVQFQ
jgi:hypothetical protein